MSWQAFHWTTTDEVANADISPAAHHVLMVMAKWADEWGRGVFAGVEEYARLSHQSGRTVQRALRELEGARLIVVAADQSPAAVKRPKGKRATVYDLSYSPAFKRWVKVDLAEKSGPTKPRGRSKGHLRAV